MFNIAITFLIALSFHASAAKIENLITIDDGKAHYIVEIMKHTTWPNEDITPQFDIILLGTNKELLQAVKDKALYQAKNSGRNKVVER